MSVESDGIGESFDEQMRVGAMAAMQVGERIARTLQEERRRAQEQTQQETVRQQQRLDAERRTALVDLAVVRNSDWWKDAQPEEIADKYALARGFRDEDPEIARHEEFMRGELKQRYGIDTNEYQDVDPNALRDEVQRIETNRADPSRQLETADAAQTHREQPERLTQDEYERASGHRGDNQDDRAADDRAQARDLDERAKVAEQRAKESERQAESETDPDSRRQLHEQAARDQQEAETLRGDANHSYDSAERRTATAGTMREQGGDQKQIDTAMRNDIAQGRPAQDAVRDAPGRKQATAQGRSQSPLRDRLAQRTR